MGDEPAHWFGPRGESSRGRGHPVMFGNPRAAAHFDPMPDGGGYPKGFVAVCYARVADLGCCIFWCRWCGHQ